MINHIPVVLLILDGWGYSEETSHNAIAAAHTPQWDEWWKSKPHVLLDASGLPVGLPDAQMGNSEVGHMHIGAGRIIPQDLTRITASIHNGEFYKNDVLIETINAVKSHHKTLHVMGLLSPGGVHSHENHLFAFLELCQQQQFQNVCLHLFLDGRDTPPQSALRSIEKLQDMLLQNPVGRIASISGRYYAMDRDKRWDRVALVYQLLTEGRSNYHFNTAAEAIQTFYDQKINDEFIPPTRIGDLQPMHEGDSVLFFNFRADRARQLTEALILDDFEGFDRCIKPVFERFVSLTEYAQYLPTSVAFPPINMHNTLGEILAQHGLRQLRIAETEKYAHVTFFFNGGSERVFPQEQRILIPSPQVKTYDLKPEMSAKELTHTLVSAIESQSYDVIICNYANADMVGHSGQFEATVRAIECLDQAMHTIWQALAKVGGQLLITADHGNAESMFDETTNQAQTAHTNHPVPLLYIGGNRQFNGPTGSLIDVAPTLLALLGIQAPKEMTGRVLWSEHHTGQPSGKA